MNKEKLKNNYPMYDFRKKADCVRFFIDTNLNRTLTMFTYKNLPKSLPERELELILQLHGYGVVTKHNDELVALWGSFTPPLDIYYRPMNVRVVNPWADIDKEYKIYNNEDGVLIRNDPLNKGLLPILNKYGLLQTEIDLTMFIAMINYRATMNIVANNDNEKLSADTYLKDLEDGKLASMQSEEFSEGIHPNPNNAGNGGYLTQVIELSQYIKGSFLNEIGLNANYNMKRERLTANETDLNEDYLRPLIDSMLEERQNAIKEINEKYGTNIEVEYNSSWAKYNEGENVDGQVLNDNSNDDVVDSVSDTNKTDTMVTGIEVKVEETINDIAEIVEEIVKGEEEDGD